MDLTAEEMELILHALKAYGEQKQASGLARDQVDNLVARLEVIDRQNRFRPAAPRSR